jgi:hypothetical protein
MRQVLLAVVLLGALSSGAGAQGRIPFVRVGGVVVFGEVPFVYHQTEFSGELSPNETTGSVSAFGFAPELRVRLDLEKFLFYGDGFYNPFDSPIGFRARGGLLFGSLLGGRSTAQLTTFAGTTYTSTSTIEHYEVHAKTIPLFYGLLAGVGVLSMRDATMEAIGIQPERHKQGGMLVTLEAGFGLMSGQFEVVAAPLLELTSGMPGIRWHVEYAFPIGSIPLYYHLAGEHLFGDASDRPVTYLLSTGIGIGSGMGVSAD